MCLTFWFWFWRDGAPPCSYVRSGGGAAYISSAPSQGTRPRFASGTLRALPENTLAPLRAFDVTTEDTPLHPLRKTLSPRFSKRGACVHDTGITNWKGEGAVAFSAFRWLRRAYVCRACILHTSSAPSQGTRPRFASGTLRAHPEGVVCRRTFSIAHRCDQKLCVRYPPPIP